MKRIEDWTKTNLKVLKTMIELYKNKGMNLSSRKEFMDRITNRLDADIGWGCISEGLIFKVIDEILKNSEEHSYFIDESVMDLSHMDHVGDVFDEVLYGMNTIPCGSCGDYFTLTKREMDNRPMTKFICEECTTLRKEDDDRETREALKVLKKKGYKVTK